MENKHRRISDDEGVDVDDGTVVKSSEYEADLCLKRSRWTGTGKQEAKLPRLLSLATDEPLPVIWRFYPSSSFV